MGHEYGVFVQTPPPSETFMVARGKTLDEARKLAMKWGEISWHSPNEGIAFFGEEVMIEEIKTPLRRGEPLRFPKWDEIFETGIFEKYLAPELGFHLTKYDEVVAEERKEWGMIWGEVEKWILNALQMRRIELYSLQGSAIYPSDLKDMIKELEQKKRIPEGPREWIPAKHDWERPLAKAFKKILKVNE